METWSHFPVLRWMQIRRNSCNMHVRGFHHQYLLDLTAVSIKLLMKVDQRCHFYTIFNFIRPIVINAALFHTYLTQIVTFPRCKVGPKLKANLMSSDDVSDLFISIIPLEADNSRRISFTYFCIRFRYSILFLGWLCNVHASITLVHLIDDWYIWLFRKMLSFAN